ncbi:MAG: hypothetical protein V4480_03780 [Patescibacteria group bacterium]
MTDEASISRIEQLLEETKELAEENNRLLRDIRRTNRISFWSKVILWTVVLILPFIFLGPLLRALVPATGTGVGGGTLFGLPSPTEFQKIIDTYRAGNTSQ